MEKKKVVVMALHDELESAYPPLKVAASSGADVDLAFSRRGVNILDKQYVPVPSLDLEYLSNALNDFGVSSVHNLHGIAVEMGAQLYVVDLDVNDQFKFIHRAEQVPIKWLLNEEASADLFMHF